MKTVMIAAKAKNNTIGNLNTIPWHLPSDLAHFKKTTMGGVMVMGSRTWESLRCRALPGRHHVVISSKSFIKVQDKDADRVHHVSDLDAAFKLGGFLAQKSDDPTVFVIGGAHVYEQAIDRVDELIITEIDREYPGDRFFPEIDPTIWQVGITYIPDQPELPYRIVTYVRNK